jgi:hypothetical protein
VTLPAPGDAGWSPMEAAEALLPEPLARIWAAGAKLDEMAELATALMRLIRDRADLTVEGRDLTARLDAPRVRIPRDVFGTPTFIFLDILEETIKLGPPGARTWQLLHAATVVRVVPPPAFPSRDRVASTAAAEARCRAWIADLAEAHPHRPPQTKPALFAQAAGRFVVSRRGFDRAWDSAAPAAWKAAGRRNRIRPEN